MIPLLNCPFCGNSASIEQIGNSWQSTIYRCDNCGCSLETGEEFNHGALWNRRIPIEAGNGGYGSRVRGWFVKDCADGWICFDNEEDAKLQVDATGAMMLVGFAPYDPIVKSAAEQFAKWLDDGPKLAKAAGCYVGIKVTNLPSPPSPSNEGEKP